MATAVLSADMPLPTPDVMGVVACQRIRLERAIRAKAAAVDPAFSRPRRPAWLQLHSLCLAGIIARPIRNMVTRDLRIFGRLLHGNDVQPATLSRAMESAAAFLGEQPGSASSLV